MKIKALLYGTAALALLVASTGLGSKAAIANQWIAQDADVEGVPDTTSEEVIEDIPEGVEEVEETIEENVVEEVESAALEPGDVVLYERPSYIGECRSSGAMLLTVYEDASLTLPIGDIEPYTRITLTGVLGDGVAQLEEPLGWVRAATLLLNCDAGPTPNPEPEVGACYQVVPTVGLIARETPAGSAQTYQGQIDGPAGQSRVYGMVPVQRQVVSPYTWQQVTYTSLSGGERTGWVAEARGTQRNLVACPSA